MKLKFLRTPRLALTLGEPAGIGLDLVCMLAKQSLSAEVVIVGCAKTLLQRAKQHQIELSLIEFDPNQAPIANGDGRFNIIDIPVKETVVAGKLNGANSAYVLETLRVGYEQCARGNCDGLVTLPVHKGIISQSGFNFSGHTEFFAHLAQVEDVLMTFYTPELILGQITTHCALKDVSKKITAKRIRKAVTLMHDGLVNIFNYQQPRIEVLGLNPHAGESGTIGEEEVDLITPTLDALRQEGYPVTGPVSGDTAFIPPRLAEVDAILAMYHDQGLGPLKALFFGQIVNITLGLPFLRTSVDHGTALDIAGTLNGSITSLIFAIEACANFAFTHDQTRLAFVNSVQPA